ncbi:hypothetical protein E4T56_gene16663 [Termitomyces sp. T112]|nr:hypothetical protein E4T56_gene16663 [Termitomyces sp. T112]
MPKTISLSSDVQTPPPAKVSAGNTPTSPHLWIPAWECCLPHCYIVASTPSTNSLKLQVEIETTDTQQIQSVVALLDSGATGLFLDTDYVQQNCFTTHPLSHPIPVYNVDATLNEAGSICFMVDLVLHYQDHSEQATSAVMSLGKQDMILEFTWLCEHNPEINWTKKEACKEHLPYADLNLLSPPLLVFSHREALYKDVQGVGCESPEEEGVEGEWTHTPDAESPDETIEEPPQQAALDALKKAVTSEPVLLFPNNDSPFCVEADSSDFAMGAVLFQQSKKDGKWHPVAFYSKTLNAVEWNYDIHDKEMLAIIWSFEEWQHFLEGTWYKFEVWTDHKNLEYLCSAKKLNQHQAWWSLYLANFDFSLHHKPGWSMGKPDALFYGIGAGDNSNIVLIKLELFAIWALEVIMVQGDEANILRDI